MSQSTILSSVDLFATAHVELFATGSGELLTYAATIGGTQSIALADTGSSRNILNTAVTALPYGTKTHSVTAQITTATGAIDASAVVAPSVDCTISGQRTTLSNVLCTSLPGLRFGLVCGMPFFQDDNPTVDWSTRSISFPETGHHWAPSTTADELAPPMRLRRATTAVDRGEGYFIQIPTISDELLAAAQQPYAAEQCHWFDGLEVEVNGVTIQMHGLESKRTPVTMGEPTADQRDADIAKLKAEFASSTTTSDNLPHVDDHERKGVTLTNRHHIEIEPAAPPFRPRAPMRLTVGEDLELRRQLVYGLRHGFLRPSKSSWAPPVFFVPKAGGKLRMVIDYRQLNGVAVKDRWPTPRVQSHLDFLAGNRWQSSIDLVEAYNQVLMTDDSVEKTAITTEHGLYEYLVMPFGLTNACATFHKVTQSLFGPGTDHYKNTRAFSDDLGVATNGSWKDHLAAVHAVLTTLRDNGLWANLTKSQFGVDVINHLGHRVSAKGIQPSAARVTAMQSWPSPTSHAELRTFIGHVTYLSRFIRDFARWVKPLNAIRSGQPGSGGHQPAFSALWTAEHKTAFDTLREAVTTAPVLQPPDFDAPFYVQYDASKVAVAAALLQRHDELLLPVAYTSRSLTPPETRWPIYDLEFGALIQATIAFRPYLLHSAHRWVALGDHKPLTHFATQPMLGLRQLRQLDHLSQYDFEFQYLPGSQLTYADPLSRPPGVSIDYESVQPTFAASPCADCAGSPCGHAAGSKLAAALHPLSAITTDDLPTTLITTNYPLDPYTHKINSALRDATNTSAFKARYTLEDDGLITMAPDHHVPAARRRILLPALPVVTDVLIRMVHDTPTSGHTAIDTTFRRFTERYHMKAAYRIVATYVRACRICRLTRRPLHLPYGKQHPLDPPSSIPGADLSTDFTFCLPPSADPILSGVTYTGIQVYVCRLTKRVRFLPVVDATITAEQCADLYIQQMLPHFGMMRTLVSDRDPRFTSLFWTELARVLQIKLKLSTPYHPQTDGQSEETIRWMKEMIRAFCTETQSEWASLLPQLESCVNATCTDSRAHSSPMQIWQGFNPASFNDYVSTTAMQSASTAAADRVATQQRALIAARAAMVVAQDVSAHYASRKQLTIALEPGDYAYVHKAHVTPPAEREGASYSLRPTMVGPFLVVRKIGSNAYELDLPAASFPNSHRVFNASALEPETNAQPGEPAYDGDDHRMLDEHGDVVYEIDKVLQHRVRSFGKTNRRQWLVRWRHHSAAFDTWEQLPSFIDAAGTTADQLIRFEQARLGDSRHVTTPLDIPPYPVSPPSNSVVTRADGWKIVYCDNNATPNSIAAAYNVQAQQIVDFNLETVPGITRKSRLKPGTAVRLVPPTPAS